MKRLLASLAIGLSLVFPVHADETINQLTAGSALSGTEQIPMFQGANPAVTTTPNAIKTYIAPVTSISTSCGVSGGPITSTGTISGQTSVNPQTGANYAFQSTDCGKLVNLSNASAQIPTLSSAATFGAGWFVNVCNQGAGTQTITPTTSTIGGAANYVLGAGTAAAPICVGIVSDGTNYQVIPSSGGGSGPGGTSGQIQTNNGSGGFAGIANISLTQEPTGLNNPGYKANVWYLPLGTNSLNTGGGTPALTTAYCSIAQIGGNSLVTITALGARIGTVGTTNIQLAIYNDNASGSVHRPGTLIDSTPNILSTSATAVSGSLNATHQISPGFYWLCLQTGDISVRYYVNNGSNNGILYTGQVGSTTLSNMYLNQVAGVSTTTGVTAFGTWPDFTSATFTEIVNTAPMVALEFSSVP